MMVLITGGFHPGCVSTNKPFMAPFTVYGVSKSTPGGVSPPILVGTNSLLSHFLMPSKNVDLGLELLFCGCCCCSVLID